MTTDEPNIDAPDGVEQVWTYAGRRARGGRRFYAWLDGDGAECLFAKLAGIAIGARYTVHVRHEGDRTFVLGQPIYTGDRVDPDTRAGFEAADVAAMATIAAAARERSDARSRALDAAIAPLEAIAGKLAFSHERDALVAYVIRRLSREWGPARGRR